jgi:hypothetical protein
MFLSFFYNYTKQLHRSIYKKEMYFGLYILLAWSFILLKKVKEVDFANGVFVYI